jgi:hypothetical protein
LGGPLGAVEVAPFEHPARGRATYGANLDRLIEGKATYDPGNLFRSNRHSRALVEGPASFVNRHELPSAMRTPAGSSYGG